MMLTEGDMLDARAAAESIMLDRASVSRGSGEWVTDPVTGEVGPAGTVLGVFPCKVQVATAQAASPEAGGHSFTVEQLQVHFPVASSFRTGDEATITEALDPDLVGLTFRLVELARGSYRTADRWNVELVTA